MERIRSPFQGVLTIIRFNWHLYLIAGFGIVLAVMFASGLTATDKIIITGLAILTALTMGLSLAVSYYVYDRSDLYSFNWVDADPHTAAVINITAGFDESSIALRTIFPSATLTVFNFYDSKKHTAVSIRRAQKVYPSYPNTITVSTTSLPANTPTADKIFLILAAHEIRNTDERIAFFNGTSKLLKENGEIVVVEHVRNTPNILAYSAGVLHFHSRKTWLQTFGAANLAIAGEQKITPFITVFTLKKYGSTS